MIHKTHEIPQLEVRRPVTLVVLGAGRPPTGGAPSALRVLDRHRKVLDWTLHAFGNIPTDTFFVGGYQLDEVVHSYPSIKFIYNPNWKETGANGSLFLVPLDPNAVVYVCYSDIVFRRELVDRFERLHAHKIVAAVDDKIASSRRGLVDRVRTDHEMLRVSTEAVDGLGFDAEFVGIARFPASSLNALARRDAAGEISLRRKHLSALIGELAQNEESVDIVSATNLWSDLENDRDLTRFVFGTKAETLERLEGRLEGAHIPPQYRFTVEDWRRTRESVVADILTKLGHRPFAVRSSAMTEDGFSASNAGKFRSVLNVSAEPEALRQAITQVILSYGDDRTDHYVFVQPMIENVEFSGVLLTRTLQTGGPYRSVAWSDSKDTDAVTGGKSENQNFVVISRTAERDRLCGPGWILNLLDAVEEIEFLMDNDALDVEFGIDKRGVVHILQVRPLVLEHSRTGQTDDQVVQNLRDAEARYVALEAPALRQVGRVPVWGRMPDWNPAEIIGVRPGRLAFDLYDYLICSETWATQRAEYGYRDVRPWPLLRQFSGHAYVDVRASFNSFVPASLSDETAQRLVDAYLTRLIRQPELHDKVEFDIALTCWSFDLKEKLRKLAAECSLKSAEREHIEQSLVDITRRGILRTRSDLNQSSHFSNSLEGERGSVQHGLDQSLALLETCRRYGTLPFAHLARSAFVAMALLKSAVSEQLIAPDRFNRFLRSVRTVGHQFMSDAYAVRSGEQSFREFSERYGHLRPGTYNILSPSYRREPEKFLKPVVDRAQPVAKVEFSWRREEIGPMIERLNGAGISVDQAGLDQFFRDAIEGREYSKFVFTRALSAALDGFHDWGEGIGLSPHDLADMALGDIVAITRGTLAGSYDVITDRIEASRKIAALNALVELPPLLTSRDDFYAYRHSATDPNFITDAVAIGAPRDLEGRFHDANLEGAIVFIPNADPGFDWIFGHAIAGLVTVYGGVNSHMAIRAAEFGLPAAIGIGEVKFRNLRKVELVELNCRERRLQALHAL